MDVTVSRYGTLRCVLSALGTEPAPGGTVFLFPPSFPPFCRFLQYNKDIVTDIWSRWWITFAVNAAVLQKENREGQGINVRSLFYYIIFLAQPQ